MAIIHTISEEPLLSRDANTTETVERPKSIVFLTPQSVPTLIVLILMSGFVIIFLGLRLHAQMRHKKSFTLDNIVLVTAAVVYFAAQGLVFTTVLIPAGAWLTDAEMIRLKKVRRIMSSSRL